MSTVKYFLILIVLSLAGIGLMFLPSPEAFSAEPAAAAEAADDPMQMARGAKSWSDNCGRCHNMREPAELRDDQWRVVVAHMRVRANLTGEETRDITAFLQSAN